MRLYDSLEMFDTGLSHVRKWMRCGQAIRQSTRLPLDTAYSLGDSLTFWAVPAGALADDRYVGHRRYHGALAHRRAVSRVCPRKNGIAASRCIQRRFGSRMVWPAE